MRLIEQLEVAQLGSNPSIENEWALEYARKTLRFVQKRNIAATSGQ